MVLIVIWKTVSRPCCTLICFVSSFSNSSIFLTSTLRSIAKEMSLKHISLFLINFAVANSWCSLIGWKAAKRVPSRHQEPLLSVIVPAVMIGTKIANKVHHITYLRKPLHIFIYTMFWHPWQCMIQNQKGWGKEGLWFIGELQYILLNHTLPKVW